MFGIDNYFAFVIAGILLNLTPGADTIYILTRSVAYGRRAGIYSVLGISTGCLVHTIFAAFGLSMILSTSALIYNIIKFVGAGYLIYLGIKMYFDKSNLFENQEIKPERNNLFQIYKQGLITNVFNPKVALFFLSFLPQFISANDTYGSIPFLILGATFFTTGTLWCLFLAYSSSLMTHALRRNKSISRILQKVSGAIFVGLGLKLGFDRS